MSATNEPVCKVCVQQFHVVRLGALWSVKVGHQWVPMCNWHWGQFADNWRASGGDYDDIVRQPVLLPNLSVQCKPCRLEPGTSHAALEEVLVGTEWVPMCRWRVDMFIRYWNEFGGQGGVHCRPVPSAAPPTVVQP